MKKAVIVGFALCAAVAMLAVSAAPVAAYTLIDQTTTIEADGTAVAGNQGTQNKNRNGNVPNPPGAEAPASIYYEYFDDLETPYPAEGVPMYITIDGVTYVKNVANLDAPRGETYITITFVAPVGEEAESLTGTISNWQQTQDMPPSAYVGVITLLEGTITLDGLTQPQTLSVTGDIHIANHWGGPQC